jgi:hypothetical protein
MKMASNREKAVLSLLLVLLLSHAAMVFYAQLGRYKSKNTAANDQVPVFNLNTILQPESELALVSRLFDIEPLLKSENSEPTEQPTLLQAGATLLAVSESAEQFSAKIALTEQNKSRIVTIKQGETLLDFELIHLTLNQAEFAKGEHVVTLHMFKRDAPSDTK